MRSICFAISFSIVAFCAPLAFGWSEAGHHVIARIAFSMMEPEEQQILVLMLESHPQWDSEFRMPEEIETPAERRKWLIGRAGYWPDVARRYKQWNRPNWHYELGASLTMGDPSTVRVPATNYELPDGAMLYSEDLNISQALKLCSAIMRDASQPAADRAIALCWITHLVADAHQPCHTGSLYASIAFPDGDRGGNSVKTTKGQNLHTIWDGLLGRGFSGAVRRREVEIASDARLIAMAKATLDASDPLDYQLWISEGRAIARESLYTSEIRDFVATLADEDAARDAKVELSEAYLKNAGRVAQERALIAAHRLKLLWRASLPDATP